MSKEITVGEFLEATEGLSQDEVQAYYEENVKEELPLPAPPPGIYELSDDEFDIIQGLILSARVQGEKFPDELMDKFGVTEILDRYIDIIKGKQPND